MDSPQVSRRRVAQGIAWSTPVVTVVAAAPAIAASGVCPEVPGGTPGQTGYTVTGPALVGSQVQAYPTGWSGKRFDSYRDGGALATDINPQNTVVTTRITIQVTAGRTYTFASAEIGSDFGNLIAAAGAARQTIEITAGSLSLFKGTTRALSGFESLRTADGALTRQTFALSGKSVTATATGPLTITLKFTIWPRSRVANAPIGWNIGCDDIVFYGLEVVCS